jgi:regulator of nonsense transcripts 1
VQQGLNVTLFDRLSGTGLRPLLLDTQYRMHPGVAAFPSAHVYGGRLKDGVRAVDKPVPAGLAWPDPARPVVFLQAREAVSRAT